LQSKSDWLTFGLSNHKLNNRKMKITHVAVLWHYTKIVFAISLVLWISETCWFLVTEGWHLEATSEYEKTFDKVVSVMNTIGLFMFLFVIISCLEYLLNKDEE